MQFTERNIPIEYSENYFNTALELTWFIFLEELNVSKNLISSEPFHYNQGIHFHPSLRFSFREMDGFDIFGIVKPLDVGEFRSALTLYDYIYGDKSICVLGKDNHSYLLFRPDTRIESTLTYYFDGNTMLWRFCVAKVEELIQSVVKSDLHAFEADNMVVTYKKPGL